MLEAVSELFPGQFEFEEDIEAICWLYAERGWSDGLPIIPPTPVRVERMLGGADPTRLIAVIPPRRGGATLQVIAINAVMAGCQPAFLPVVVAAVKAMSHPHFNLRSIQTTTHPATPLIVVNGKIRHELGINCAAGCYGAGPIANATIGRAVRLTLLNAGGAGPGGGDRSTQGNPAKYAWCIGENEEASPWNPLSVERGLAPGDGAVTVIGGASPQNINDHVSTSAIRLLTVCADCMCTLGTNNLFSTKSTEMHLVLSPEHAATVAGDGWSKREVKQFLYERARLSKRRLREGGLWGMHSWPKWFDSFGDDELVPIVSNPDNFVVIVAGGEGKHSSCISTTGSTRSVTVPIEPVFG